MPLHHGRHGFPRPGLLSRHFDRRGHQGPHWSGFRIEFRQGQFPQHIALGKDAGNPAFAVHHADRAHMIVEHFVNGCRDRRFSRNRGHLRIAELQQIHRDLPITEPAWKDLGIMTHASGVSRESVPQAENLCAVPGKADTSNRFC